MKAVKAMGRGMVSRYGDRPARESWQPAFSIRASAGGMEPGSFKWELEDGEGMQGKDWPSKRPAPTIVGTRRSSEGIIVGRQLGDDSRRDVGGPSGGRGLTSSQLPGVRVTAEEARTLQTYPPFKIERGTMRDLTQHKVLDLFAGSGVGVAIQNLGAEEFGVENMKEAIATREANGMKTVYENVWDAHKAEMLIRSWRNAGIKWTLWASPPCQTFSLAGNGAGRKALDDVLGIIARKQYIDMAELREQAALLGDERIGLVLSPLHYAVRFRPTYIAFEQVPPRPSGLGGDGCGVA